MSIRADNVHFAFGKRRVLNAIDHTFQDGSTLLLGPNGAGKSTLMEVLASVRRPDTGRVLLDNVLEPGPNRAHLRKFRKSIAWLPQIVVPYPGVNVREHVALAGWLKGMTKSTAWEESSRALAQVQLSKQAKNPVGSLSGGQMRRMGIAGALVHNAEVILLDEPTANLDPAQRLNFRTIVEPLAEHRTIVISSHDTNEAVSLYQSVVVLVEGHIRFSGSMDEFLDSSGTSLSEPDRLELAYIRWAGATE